MAPTVCANPSLIPVDLWTTRSRVAHRVHSSSNNSSSRAEQNEKCVTHVSGQNCYPCPRLLKRSERGEGFLRRKLARGPLTRLARKRSLGALSRKGERVTEFASQVQITPPACCRWPH